MNTINQLQQNIVNAFSEFADGFDQYSYLIELAALFTPIGADRHTGDKLVKGCQSKVWLDMRVDSDHTFFLEGDSDTLILKGVLSLLQYIFNGQPVSAVANASVWFFDQTSIMGTFSDARQKGIGYAIRMIQDYANAACTE